MPATAVEKYRGRSVGDTDAQILYLVRGTEDPFEARDAVESTAPGSYDSKPIHHVDIEQIHTNIWYATAIYQRPAGASVEEPQFSFDTGGGSQHVKQSLRTMGRYAPTGLTAPDFGGAIGVTSQGVEGVDLVIPVYHWQETHIVAASEVDDDYKQALKFLTGKMNNDTFRGAEAGEALFLGAAGNKRGFNGDWEITFRFAEQDNLEDEVINPEAPEDRQITITKVGWDYLWVYFEDDVDEVAKKIVKYPVAAYVERVYKIANFDALGI